VSVSFTIAVPTHDRRETAVLAVRSALAQTRPPEQVIVLCDGCTDGTAEALRALGDARVEVTELEKAPGYGYGHRNRSLELARGEAILWLADDDLLLPDHLERIGELWDIGRFDLVQSHAVAVHPDERLEWCGSDWSVPVHRAALAHANRNPMTSVSLRVALAREIGGWDATLPRAADWDLWRRALAAGARCVTSLEPTHLHFRATGREQAWPLRVRQNAAWLARMHDPDQLLEMRIALRRAQSEHEAWLLWRIDQLEQALPRTQEELAAAHAQLAAAHTQLAAVSGELDGASAQLADAVAEAVRLGDQLAQIEAGGWWRLRRRLLPLMRLAGRGR
jgi:glycosyltransferase involved in cell wall biosynthesis